MAYFCFYHFFILLIISEYSEFRNYIKNKEMIKTDVSLLFPSYINFERSVYKLKACVRYFLKIHYTSDLIT